MADRIQFITNAEPGLLDAVIEANRIQFFWTSPYQIGDRTIRYRMRVWNLNTLSHETWTSVGAPSRVPPSGDPYTNLTVEVIWE